MTLKILKTNLIALPQFVKIQYCISHSSTVIVIMEPRNKHQNIPRKRLIRYFDFNYFSHQEKILSWVSVFKKIRGFTQFTINYYIINIRIVTFCNKNISINNVQVLHIESKQNIVFQAILLNYILYCFEDAFVLWLFISLFN